MQTQISYRTLAGDEYRVTVIVKNRREKIQANWLRGSFYEANRHGMLNYVYQKFQKATFVDVGAALGNHSLFFAVCCQAGQVYAFEPVKAAYDHLQENIAANHLTNIHAQNVAAGASNREVGMLMSNEAPEKGGMLMSRVNEQGTGVRMERLDDLLRAAGAGPIDCIKIDVEGYNLPVLEGAQQTIAQYHPAIFCECATPQEFAAVDSQLAALGYRIWRVNGKPFVMNHTPTYLWEFGGEFDLTILITTYNRPDSLGRLLNELMADARDFKVCCRVYNDGSALSYANMPCGHEAFQIETIHVQPHRGKQGYWKLINLMLQDVRQIRSRYYLQLPDDVSIRPGFLANSVDTYRSIDDPNKICLNLYLDGSRLGRACWTHVIPTICKFDGCTVFKTGWMDLIYLAERKLFEEIGYAIQPIARSRWRRKPRLGPGVGMQISKRLRRFSMYQVRECWLRNVDIPSLLNPDRPAHEDLSTITLDPIVCGVASIPQRAHTLQHTIASVLPYVDELHIYLNNYATLPSFLARPKIYIHRSQDHGDLGDAGKFFCVGSKVAYYLTIDDDIIYPEDYVWRLVREIRQRRRLGQRIALGFHGKVMKGRVRHFYKDHMHLFHAGSALQAARTVHVLGTGTMGFHTADLQITLADFAGPRNMADIHFSIACQKQNVACVVLPRRRHYLKMQKVPLESSIWGTLRKEDKAPTDLYNRWSQWQLRV